ncbi:hypothetical protein Fmac_008170 [Flemingia macrophylla]|uniref:Uncharacterized protein n=1 Tax=Flemingia macrophylla TaxID=520843 RepID=A0ABD1MWM3_9FABA
MESDCLVQPRKGTGAMTCSLSTLLSYLTCPTVGNVSDCRAYTAIYAPSLSDQYGPTSPGTAKCLFGLDFSSHSSGKRRAILISLVSVFCFLALLLFFALWAYLRCKKRRGLLAWGKEIVLASGLDSMNQRYWGLNFRRSFMLPLCVNTSRKSFPLSVADMECVGQGIIETQDFSFVFVYKTNDDQQPPILILGLIPSAFTFAADNTVPGCWLVFPCLLCA